MQNRKRDTDLLFISWYSVICLPICLSIHPSTCWADFIKYTRVRSFLIQSCLNPFHSLLPWNPFGPFSMLCNLALYDVLNALSFLTTAMVARIRVDIISVLLMRKPRPGVLTSMSALFSIKYPSVYFLFL